jgi:hypothetical protein
LISVWSLLSTFDLNLIQLGNGNMEPNSPSLVIGSSGFGYTYYYSSPLPDQIFSPRKKVLSVACGANHTVVLTKDGELFSWGSDQFGQLGMFYLDN